MLTLGRKQCLFDVFDKTVKTVSFGGFGAEKEKQCLLVVFRDKQCRLAVRGRLEGDSWQNISIISVFSVFLTHFIRNDQKMHPYCGF